MFSSFLDFFTHFRNTRALIVLWFMPFTIFLNSLPKHLCYLILKKSSDAMLTDWQVSLR